MLLSKNRLKNHVKKNTFIQVFLSSYMYPSKESTVHSKLIQNYRAWTPDISMRKVMSLKLMLMQKNSYTMLETGFILEPVLF